tara:strand:+ start:124 stop:408 length:285 start_codon:yes stop_codon:yes gene_type:complete
VTSQLVLSLGTDIRDETIIVSAGHAEQELASTNGLTSGDDMYLFARQHPYLAVLLVLPLPRLLNAFSSPVKLSHLLPHNVRLNPLFVNTKKKVR